MNTNIANYVEGV